jgi:hypothetical protein
MASSDSVEKKEGPAEKEKAAAVSVTEAAEKKPEDDQGPPVYVNWLWSQQDKPLLHIQEFPLYTDAHIVAETKHGPYEFLNTIAMIPGVMGIVRPAVILRYELYWTFPYPNFSKTNTDRYHGGSPADEMAALASLAIGVRFRAGDSTRDFEPRGDPKGRPRAFGSRSSPVLTKSPLQGWIVPQAAKGQHSLELLKVLEVLPKLTPKTATTLIRAARLFQDALWLAESEPAIAWLLLVSALETAADHWRSQKEPALVRFQTAKPDLYEELCKYNSKLADLVAQEFADSFGATRKFIDFVMKFRPPEPVDRPPWGGIDWSEGSMEKILKMVYNYRSKALHAGKPFPAPMSQPPYREGGWVAMTEKPQGHTSMSGGVWLDSDTPILLSTFEYIARETLLNWWNAQEPRE